MKKQLIGASLVIAVLALGWAPQAAQADSGTVSVSGKIIDSRDSRYYLATFSDTQCPVGSIIKVFAWKTRLGLAGTASGTIKHKSHNHMNVWVKCITPVPEFNWIGSVMAVGTGMGVVIFMRRRYA
jgi:hypothetical protein